MNENNLWDKEYLSQGIPSSIRDNPSGVLLWCLRNIEFLGLQNIYDLEALDVGCGRGRNSIHLNQQGFKVTGIDSSSVAIESANKLANSYNSTNLKFIKQRLQVGLPGTIDQYSLITDIFVYKHQVDYTERRAYRERISNLLKQDGLLLLSLADKDDGYYRLCPRVENNNKGLVTITDPIINIKSVLFNLEELINEMQDCFKLEMAWVKEKNGKMHGKSYLRKTIATIWRPIK